MSEEEGELLPFPGPAAPEDPDVQALVPVIEALLFASGEPVGVRELCAALDEVLPGNVRAALELLRRRHAREESGLELVRVGGGWQLRTDPRFAGAVLRLRGARPQKLSRAALETLAVVAYRQPVTRQEVEDLRGVDSGGVIKTLIERGVLAVVGRSDDPGRPLRYGTTRAFLEMFALPSLDDLPTLREREELEEDRAQPFPVQGAEE